MNCLDFEERWNEILDSPTANAEGSDRDLDSHASTCERCRAEIIGYQILRQAVSAMKPPTGPSPASIERLYALTVPLKAQASTSSFSIWLVKKWVPPAIAAAVFAMAGLGVIWWPLGKPMAPATRPVPKIASTTAPMIKPLGLALAEATVATIDLARETSVDASRIGRELYEIGKDSVEVPDFTPNRVAEVSTKIEANPLPSDVLQTVGDRLSAGVSPISGQARHAFGFLLGRAGEPEASPTPLKRDSL